MVPSPCPLPSVANHRLATEGKGQGEGKTSNISLQQIYVCYREEISIYKRNCPARLLMHYLLRREGHGQTPWAGSYSVLG